MTPLRGNSFGSVAPNMPLNPARSRRRIRKGSIREHKNCSRTSRRDTANKHFDVPPQGREVQQSSTNEHAGELVMKAKKICGLIVALSVATVSARADSLELKNGSLIKGKFMGGNQTSISFQVGSSLQSYDVADIRSLRFESDAQGTSPSVPPNKPSTTSTTEPDEIAK